MPVASIRPPETVPPEAMRRVPVVSLSLSVAAVLSRVPVRLTVPRDPSRAPSPAVEKDPLRLRVAPEAAINPSLTKAAGSMVMVPVAAPPASLEATRVDPWKTSMAERRA